MSATGMPAHLLSLFAPRPPLERLPWPKKRKHAPYTGLSDLVNLFETTPPPKVEPFEAPKERRERIKKEKLAQYQEDLKNRIAEYKPLRDPEKIKTADPRKTLFVGRLSYETTEKKLLKTFEAYGQIRDIRLVTDKSSKPRGYAFIEFRSSDGLRAAYREANERNLDGRRIVVDIEKARIIRGWLPRRLGGGEGPPRCGISKKVLQQRALERRNTGKKSMAPGPRPMGGDRRSMGGLGGPMRRGRGGFQRSSM
eukprot:Blabericola_migrator_1__1724@NODE_1463_length_4505_cov_224_617846_g238_i2_p3_GENE_NODE_1463_length_4505_cov_224_617846_g238_i2NODE_1463_length_4505_cov_224_617846_g238_i2_p3_ORF_typecomplete_len253_score36_31RRM_1/PF00076_22/1_3e19U1snRNP70_N/PF12220_8/2e16RRM_5/PF13893_6/1_2e06RRM_7/PF16367_5/1_8e04RRM_7/PF16367_5/3_4e06RL/PF17797_1/3_1e05RRM_occluded/PF16842_5/0_14PHM7_cyt/PF14703_6/0_18RRM_2/PF04059_12/0_26Strep_SA_rep/PF06696_11/0_45Strep_SA_rep/PF06696_11/1_8e03_NODE_1463_length_4505_cov_22